MRRREFFLVMGSAAVALPHGRLSAQQGGAMPAQMDAGGHKPVVLPRKAEAKATLSADDVKKMEGGLRCQCGTCRLDIYTCRTTDVTCPVSPAMHRDIDALVTGGHSAQEIIDAFVGVYGEKVRMAPRAEGFNTIGYLAPYLAMGGAAMAAAVWISRSLQRQRVLVASDAQSTPIPIHGTKEELERIERELRDGSQS